MRIPGERRGWVCLRPPIPRIGSHLLGWVVAVKDEENSHLCEMGDQVPQPSTLLKTSKLIFPGTRPNVTALTKRPPECQGCKWQSSILRCHLEVTAERPLFFPCSVPRKPCPGSSAFRILHHPAPPNATCVICGHSASLNLP